MPLPAAEGPVAARNPNSWISRNLSIVTIVRVVPIDSPLRRSTLQAIHPCSSARNGKPVRATGTFVNKSQPAPIRLNFRPTIAAAWTSSRFSHQFGNKQLQQTPAKPLSDENGRFEQRPKR